MLASQSIIGLSPMLERNFLTPSKFMLETSISLKDEDSNCGSLHRKF